MTAISPIASPFERISTWLITAILPIGWIALLTGMLWVGERPIYHKLFYALIAAPTLLVLLLRPHYLKALTRPPLVLAFLLFGAYTLTTLLWSSTDDPFSSLVKRPLYVLFLLFSAELIALREPEHLWRSIKAGAVLASLAALVSACLFLNNGAVDRFAGYGALDNPLLSSHVYGFFLVFWAAHWLLQRSYFDPLSLISIAVFGALILATGSRTPLLAITASLIWLQVVNWNKRSLIAVGVGTLAIATLLIGYPGALINRGLSSRPEIWKKAWQQILEAPWLGHGYEAPMQIWISAHDYAMADPHNMFLAVFYYCGAVGLVLWLALYAIAFRLAWKNRKQPWGMISSALLVFGLTASMTEGGAFLSRPKEHWFLIWIPMALLAAVHIISRNKEQAHAAIEKN